MDLAGRSRIFVDNIVKKRGDGIRNKWLLTGQELIENNPQGKEVGPAVDLRSGDLFRGHIAGGTEKDSGLGKGR